MVLSNHTFEEQALRLLAETKAEIGAAEARKKEMTKELDDKLATLTREADAYEGALQAYRRRTGKEVAGEPNWTKILEGLSHENKLKAIAVIRGGSIRVSFATDLLYSKRFIKSKKRSNAYTIVHGYLSSMTDEGLFEKVAPGEFRYVGAQLSLPGTK